MSVEVMQSSIGILPGRPENFHRKAGNPPSGPALSNV